MLHTQQLPYRTAGGDTATQHRDRLRDLRNSVRCLSDAQSVRNFNAPSIDEQTVVDDAEPVARVRMRL